MIPAIVAQWDARKDVLREAFRAEHPGGYEGILDALLKHVLVEPTNRGYREQGVIDPERVTVIDHGGYQGTQIYVLCVARYEPDESSYLWFANEYGSCSGCDAYEAVRGYRDAPPTAEQVDGYMTLALHMIQRMRWLTQSEVGE